MTMLTDNEIRIKGVEALITALGKVHAERFVSIIIREPFDYTIWQRDLWAGKNMEEISQMAMEYRRKEQDSVSE